MTVTKDIKYIGVSDRELDLFESQYKVPHGMSYNSYLIMDDSIAVMDAVDIGSVDEWLSNLEASLCGASPDYLVVHHMEPDHSAGIMHFMNRYPGARVVSSVKAFSMMDAFFGTDFSDRRIVVKEGDTLSLGRHKLTFFSAPMVHWPEVIVSYDEYDKVLFSADSFGKFGALDYDDDWVYEARRYYIGIVAKYGAQVQSLLRKIKKLDIKIICPLHGPMLDGNIGYYINLYDIWSSYRAEDGVVIAYTSVYGNTRAACNLLADKIREISDIKVTLIDLARCDMSRAVDEAFRYSRLVLATTTYNGGVFPFMREFIAHLIERGYKNRTVGFIENGSWSPVATAVMRSMLGGLGGITYTEATVRIASALNEQSRGEIADLASEIVK